MKIENIVYKSIIYKYVYSKSSEEFLKDIYFKEN